MMDAQALFIAQYIALVIILVIAGYACTSWLLRRFIGVRIRLTYIDSDGVKHERTVWNKPGGEFDQLIKDAKKQGGK